MSGNRISVRSLGTIAAMLLLSVLATGTALAATRVVDPDGFGSATNCNALTPATYTTIGAAIVAAGPGDTIKVCPGVYDEQVTVSKQVTIRGDNGAILRPTAMVANTTSLASGNPIAAAIVVRPNVGVLGNVVIESLTIDGADNGIGGCAPNLIGIFYRNASGTINKVATTTSSSTALSSTASPWSGTPTRPRAIPLRTATRPPSMCRVTTIGSRATRSTTPRLGC
jgi:nitrous oxidase accessory protein NosD